jgi:hypothetical protein
VTTAGSGHSMPGRYSVLWANAEVAADRTHRHAENRKRECIIDLKEKFSRPLKWTRQADY